eukprot:13409586-Alexandrium_andersonii.AAC.1
MQAKQTQQTDRARAPMVEKHGAEQFQELFEKLLHAAQRINGSLPSLVAKIRAQLRAGQAYFNMVRRFAKAVQPRALRPLRCDIAV